jgi:peroxiredoxin Q/BCP
MLTVGSLSPAWTAVDQDGKARSSADYLGSWLLLYFYPKDDTPGCTIEACGFRDAWHRLSTVVRIVGVSSDSSECHQKFITKYSLPFPLLADTDAVLRSAFKADGTQYPKRVTFLIRPSGHIEKVYEGFDCQNHADDIERDLVALHVLT